LKPAIKVAFATGTDPLNHQLVTRLRELYPELPLFVVSEFPPAEGRWVAYHPLRGFWENYRRCRAAFRGRRIRLAGVMLVPNVPYRRLRLIALLLSPAGFIAYNENLDHWMLRPRCLPLMLRHLIWRARNLVVFETHPGGRLYTLLWRLVRPSQWRRPLALWLGRCAGVAAAARKALRPARRRPAPGACRPPGVSVIIPSRNGRQLLASLLPQVELQLAGEIAEIIVVDNGSDDGTAEFLRRHHPGVAVEISAAPLGFAQAVNRGLARARFSHVCLLNNDMSLEAGFFTALRRAFQQVPELFCATAQILFPEGRRREETGKAVMVPRSARRPEDFPVRCQAPLAGEDLSYALYGSGGCSMYDAEKLERLGGLDEIYHPAYVEDLDLGYRAWLGGWPTVLAAEARVLHRHRATTARYYAEGELETFLQTNYLRFLARAVASPRLFLRLWREALEGLNRRAAGGDAAACRALACAWRAPLWARRPAAAGPLSDELVLALGSGDVAVFPGQPARGRPVVLIASPYLPFPLSHGGAVRMYNLMRRAAADFDQVLVAFVEEAAPPPPELREICAEIVTVRRRGSHLRPRTRRPDMVEEHDSPAFRAALRQTASKWRPAVLQLEFTQMAQYAGEAAGARTVLVEHDITFDLHRQFARQQQDWEARRQYRRWRRFETAAWRRVDCVVVMSESDRRLVEGARRVVCLPNGVDLQRFRPGGRRPEPGRLLFIGSFAHLPNLLAVDFFLREVRPRLEGLNPVLHIIAGRNHQACLERYRERAELNLAQPGIELEGFVADPRPAYERAAVVIAPLVASAGTNIKILEAMAMGKAIVSTPAGIHGLELEAGRDLLVAERADEFAAAVRRLLEEPELRAALGRQARAVVERAYDWERIATRQKELYRALMD
jgi:GT2 family glycosyltransferase/glycosyltransferase involved in cell wall biosynthesis